MSPAVAILIAATVALAGALTTLQQKRRVDRRTLWWERARWALELSFLPDVDQAAVGRQALRLLSARGGSADLALIDERLMQLLADAKQNIDGEEQLGAGAYPQSDQTGEA